MRLGGFLKVKYEGPEEWVGHHKRLGYTAAYCPPEVMNAADDAAMRPWLDAARKADLTIAEVGTWSSTMSLDAETRAKGVRLCQERLALADRIGCPCCVNLSGSLGEPWNGHHPDNLTPKTFDRVVETVREIIDAVKPARAFYTLEAMPWQFPNSTESYVRLVKAIDRKSFAVHYDPCNMVGDITTYYSTGGMIREFVAALGPHIKSVHLKDVSMGHRNTVQISEVIPGQGVLDYRTLLTELDRLGRDLPLMLEHLKTEEEYVQAAGHVRRTAKAAGVELRA